MNKPRILKIKKDSSIPWYDQIEKTVIMPGESEHKTYYAIKPSDYVTILAQTSERKIIIVKQYRPIIEGYTYEFPSGHVEKGETPAQAVIRELQEETHCVARDVILLGELMPDTGRLDNRLWAFYAQDMKINKFPDPVDNEGIEVSLVTPDELFEMINRGEFTHALDLSVVMLASSKGYLQVK